MMNKRKKEYKLAKTALKEEYRRKLQELKLNQFQDVEYPEEETVDILMEDGRIEWGKLDATAHMYPIITSSGMSNVYRVFVTLKEEIQPNLLQKALDMVLPKFNLFNTRLRQGMFWYYFEENGKPAPRVRKEVDYPCQYVDSTRNKSYLFRVTYFQNRINLEVFHVLTDGMGAFNFLKELTYQYLRLIYPDLRDRLGDQLNAATSLETQDSFVEYYQKKEVKPYKFHKAYILKGPELPKGQLGVMHGYVSVAELKKVARAYGASINEYLVAAILYAVFCVYGNEMDLDKPLIACVPVNLRPFFHSVTTKNFFVNTSAIFSPRKREHSFEQVLSQVKASLQKQINKEYLLDNFSTNVSSEKNLILRSLPWIFKKIGLKMNYASASKGNTLTITNLGEIKVAEEYESYIERFNVVLTRSANQNLKVSLTTYKGELAITISSVFKYTGIQKQFFRLLTKEGISVKLETNGVYSRRKYNEDM